MYCIGYSLAAIGGRAFLQTPLRGPWECKATCICDQCSVLMGAGSIDLTIWQQVCVCVCGGGHQEESYQECPGSSRLTNGQLRLAVWSVSSYLPAKWLFRGTHEEIAAGPDDEHRRRRKKGGDDHHGGSDGAEMQDRRKERKRPADDAPPMSRSLTPHVFFWRALTPRLSEVGRLSTRPPSPEVEPISLLGLRQSLPMPTPKGALASWASDPEGLVEIRGVCRIHRKGAGLYMITRETEC